MGSFGQLSALQRLGLHENHLTALPESFGQLTALEGLELHHNRLTALPESFGRLTALVRLGLHQNRLSVLPESFSQLTALEELRGVGPILRFRTWIQPLFRNMSHVANPCSRRYRLLESGIENPNADGRH